LARDGEYLFSKVSPIFQLNNRERFMTAFRKIAQPELIHTFVVDNGESLETKLSTFLQENRKKVGLDAKLKLLQKELDQKTQELETLRGSVSFKLGRILTSPLRKLRSLRRRGLRAQ
jgi:hypothetical protein